MDEYSSTSFANRNEAIPVIKLPTLDGDDNGGKGDSGGFDNNDDGDDNDNSIRKTPSHSRSSSQTKLRKRDMWKAEAEKLREKLQDVNAHYKTSQGSVQERLVNTLLEQVFPQETESDGTPKKDRRSRQYVDRPSFSLPLMSTNFRRFNARIGVVFVLQNEVIRLFTWVNPTHTLSFLAIYTLVCLQPTLVPVVPLAAILFFVMIPSFLTRHPPPPTSKLSSTDAAAAEQYASYGYSGPAVAPPQRVKPAPEMSKDFFRNMRDLQNCMEDFSRAHDGAVTLITPYTDFSNEPVSSTVFLILAILCTTAFIGSHLIPWRAVALLTGWFLTCAGHPEAQEILLSTSSLKQIKQLQTQVSKAFVSWTNTDIAMDEPPEIREVEIFELQKRQSSYPGLVAGTLEQGEWEPWLFTPSPYDPMSPLRIAGATRPVGTQFFEDVQPPPAWRWRDKKWTLDLSSREWVEERCVTGVEVETEGERWVYDIMYLDEQQHSQHQFLASSSSSSFASPSSSSPPPPPSSSFSGGSGSGNHSAAAAAAAAGEGGGEEGRGRGGAGGAGTKQPTRKSWEEGTGKGKRGEWRRRRWVRLVERKVVKAGSSGGGGSGSGAND